MTGRTPRAVLGALIVTVFALTGCTEIPRASAPLVIRTVERGNADAPQPNITPSRGADPGTIVNDFITAENAADAGHSSARQFLTNAAARKWQDSTTIVVDSPLVHYPTIHGDTATLRITGRRVGQLDAGGVFSPTLKGIGVGDEETFTMGLTKSNGQWRIDQLQPGVLVGVSAFNNVYHARKLYFFDSSERSLVPDLRYSALSGQPLASWLLQQLVAGPRSELAPSVLNEVPDQVGKPTVVIGEPIHVEMPGTTQLDAAGRNALGAQLAYTLGQIQFAPADLQLTDSGRPVKVPAGSATSFSTNDFVTVGPDSVALGADPYFVRDGSVINGSDDTPLPGPLGNGSYKFTSVAMRRDASGDLQVAGVSGDALEVGTSARLSKLRLPAGALSRPEWRPHSADVWVGVGATGAIYRVTPGQSPKQVSTSSALGGLPPGRVLALRFTSDGVRIAAVLRAANGTKTVWVGSVVASGADVHIDSFEPVTPAQLQVSDLAWADATKLLVVADAPTDETRVWQLFSDGSRLEALTSVGLPGPPTSIAAAPTRLPLVSANDSIWTQRGNSWVPYPISSLTPGVNPIYVP